MLLYVFCSFQMWWHLVEIWPSIAALVLQFLFVFYFVLSDFCLNYMLELVLHFL